MDSICQTEIVSDHVQVELDQSMESVLALVDYSWTDHALIAAHQDTLMLEPIAKDVNHHVLNAQVHLHSVLTVLTLIH